MPRGTHGALNKAGKVRSLTPKVERRPRRSPVPRVRIKSIFRKRFVLGRRAGQNPA
ncbi:MAG: 30S ribosomal protein S30e [Candidatus Methanodesulfokora sp.]|jgi:small subunit ribosomal protein S30e|nr:MAG: 30S ribosomal protein S30 [Candidatus Korarchaeota archaeon]